MTTDSMTTKEPGVIAAGATFSPMKSVKAAPTLVNDTACRDHALFFNGLVPLLDLAAWISAIYFSKALYTLWFANALIGNSADEGVMMVIAFLAPLLLYDRRFISVASRAQYGALIRCFVTGFLLLAGGVAVIILFAGFRRSLPVPAIALWLAVGFTLTAITRITVVAAVRYCVRIGAMTETIAVVGTGPRADRLVQFLRSEKSITPEIVGVFDDSPETTPTSVGTSGNLEDLIVLGRSRRIDWILLTLRHAEEKERVASILHRLKALSVPVAFAPPTLDLDSAGKRVDYIADVVPVTLLQYPSQGWRTSVRFTGQFLPRWIVTLITMLGLVAHDLLTRTRTLRLATERAKATKLICNLDNYDLANFTPVVRDFGLHRYGYVVTPNVDHLIRLHDDNQFRDLYSNAEYVLLDSRFLANLLSLSGTRLPVCTGSDLTARLFASLIPADRIVIVGSSEPQVSMLAQRFNLKNVQHHNPPMGFIHDERAVEACLQFIEAHSPFRYCLLAVGSPQQEKIARLLQQRGVALGLTLCVGASIDFMTGSEKRAPLWMQRYGIEWAYRLMQNPARLAKRYLVRGPRIFWLLRRTKFVLRPRRGKEVIEAAKAA